MSETKPCISCQTDVPIKEWFKYAPVILCAKCVKGLTFEGQLIDEERRAGLNLRRP